MKFIVFLASLAVLTACTQTLPEPEPAAQLSESAAPLTEGPEPTSAQMDEAAGIILNDLDAGVSGYRLAPGDRLEILFHMGSSPGSKEYILGVGDRLNVDFFFHPEATRNVIVRPDGRITLPAKGDFMAAGLTPSELQASIFEGFSDVFNEPVITVSVEEFARSEDLKETLGSAQFGLARKISVGPDGKVYLPFLEGLDAAGLSVDSLRGSINDAYSNRLGDLSVSVLLEQMVGNQIFVFGEVPNPGVSPNNQPQTVLQAVASVGGPLPTSDLDGIRVLTWDSTNNSQVQILDFNEIYDDPSKDFMLPQNSTVYVPPSGITVADRFVDQYIRQLFLFRGIGVGFNYELNRQDIDNGINVNSGNN